MASAPGRLIALEGIDGCGKSTQARLLADRLGALLTFEPGDTAVGASLRQLVLDPNRGSVAPRTEALLMASDRAQHVIDVVRPALEAGTWVVTDRYAASTLAYQGYGRGLDLMDLARIMEWATAGLAPDLYVLVEVDMAVGRARRQGSTSDRMEREDEKFRQRVADGYRHLADRQDTPWLVVDGTGSVEAVAAAVWAGVREQLGEGP